MKLKNVIFLTILLFANISWSQEEKTTLNTDLENIIIKENRLALPLNEVSRNITIINKAQIAAAPVQSVAELLQYAGGIDIRQRGVNGAQADVHFRGGGFEQVLILINGMRLNDPQTGHHNLNLPVDIENIERIEILKGPAARIFGQNAFTGAINIITKVTNEKSLNAKIQKGDFGLIGASAGLSLPTKNISQYISASYDKAEGYRKQSDYEISNVFYQAAIGKKQTYDLTAGYTARDMGAGFWYGPEVNQRENVQTNFINIATDIKVKENFIIKPNAYWRRNQDQFWYGKFPRNFHLSQINGVAVNANYLQKNANIGAGIDVSRTFLQSTRLGEHTRQTVNAFLESRFTLLNQKLDITPGINYNYFSDIVNTDNKGRFLWGIDAGYKITTGTKAFANIGTTYRVPSYTDLYYADPANEGNPNLLPEAALTYEAGLKYLKNGYNLQASFYQRATDNLIDWTRPNTTTKWKSGNIGKVNMSGIDVSAELFLPAILQKNTIIRRVGASYNYIKADINSDYTTGTFSKYALNNFKHQVIANVEIMPLKKFTIAAFYRYNERENNIAPIKYNIFDAKMAYQWQTFQVFVEATNIFDEVYYEATNGVVLPSRWITSGMKFKF